MILRDLYCYGNEEQVFEVFAESDVLNDNFNIIPLFHGLLENCEIDLLEQTVGEFKAHDNEIRVILCI